MAGSTILLRLSSVRFKAIRFKLKSNKSVLPTISSLNSSSQSQVSSSVNAFLGFQVELSCLISMMPSHSAVASARLRSVLAVESQSWGFIPQGISMPL